MGHHSFPHKILRFSGWTIAILIFLSLLYWTAVGIYEASAHPLNMEPVLFGSFQIAVFIAILYTMSAVFESDKNWWYFGTPHVLYIVILWFVIGFLTIAEIFGLLAVQLDDGFLKRDFYNLLIAMTAIQLGLAGLYWIWFSVVGVVLIVYNNTERTMIEVNPHQHSYAPMRASASSMSRSSVAGMPSASIGGAVRPNAGGMYHPQKMAVMSAPVVHQQGLRARPQAVPDMYPQSGW